MFSLAPVFFDVGSHSHSVGVNSIPPRFIPELDAFWFTKHSYDLANATAFKTNDLQKAAPVIRTAFRFFQISLPSCHRRRLVGPQQSSQRYKNRSVKAERSTIDRPATEQCLPTFALDGIRNLDRVCVVPCGAGTYAQPSPGGHLIYDVGKHHISVFVFQERLLPARLDENPISPKKQPFNMETWSQGGLRYFVIGDASTADIDSLANLFKATS